MAGRGLLPDLVSYNAAMSACETTNQWQQAAHGKEFDKILKIRTPMVLKPMLDYIAYRAWMCAGPGATRGHGSQRIEAGCHQLQCGRMSERGLVALGPKVISACGKCQQLGKSLELLKAMEERRIEATMVSFNSMIAFKTWPRALELLDFMSTKRLRCDVVGRNGGISACARGKRWPEALRLLGELVEEGSADLISCCQEVFVRDFQGF